MSKTSIVEQNNNAVYLLTQEKYDLAIALLQNALMKIKKPIHETHATSQLGNDLSTMNRIICIPIAETNLSADQTAGIQFFNRPFTMSIISAKYSSLDQYRLRIIALYNLALIHHHRGARSGKSKDLYAAMKYYKLALQMFDYAENNIDLEGMLLLYLALWNNMGNIHSSFFNVMETIECCNLIQNLLECHESSMILEDDDYDFLV
jgi:tetratricopeptide (TPR) repeat protein